MATDVALGGLAGVFAGVFTNPLEVLKTRMQLQGELQSRGHHTVHYKNMFHAAVVVTRADGITALQAGLVPALWTQLFLNGFRLGIYQICHNQGLMDNAHGELVFWKSVFVGAVTGVIGTVACSPFFLVKTQLQAMSSVAVGHQHQHTGTWSAFKKIYNGHGISGLFRGVGANIPRAAVGSTSQLTSFTFCKQWLHSRDIFTDSPILASFTAAMVGGIAVAVCMTPFDLITTRIYNQGVDARGRGLLYNGIVDCANKVWKTEGLRGFYKGLVPNYLRLGPHTVLCLVFWDELKAIHQDLFR